MAKSTEKLLKNHNENDLSMIFPIKSFSYVWYNRIEFYAHVYTCVCALCVYLSHINHIKIK